ncbi:MAG: hypothetical protein Q9183_004042 [Haloplaca sp. 2 TL-2023]
MYSILLAFLSLFTLSLSQPTRENRGRPRRVAYFQDNEPNGSSIVALKIDSRDGTLSSPVRTNTGGKGLAGTLAASQDSTVLSGDLLFTTNPGDATLSMLRIDSNDAMNPRLVGKPASTLGTIPISVAYSPKYNTACTVNGGSPASVICFSVSRRQGLTSLGPVRELRGAQVSPPPPGGAGPFIAARDIVFNPSSSALFVTVPGDSSSPGLLYAFAVSRRGEVSRHPVVTELPDLGMLFSINFLASDRRAIVTSPGAGRPGSAILDIEYPSLRAKVEKVITIPSQMGDCWVAYSQDSSRYAYVIDAGQPAIGIVDPRTDSLTGVSGFGKTTAIRAGGVDARLDRSWLYLLTNDPLAPTINVFHLESGGKALRNVQEFDIFGRVGNITSWQGLSIWPASH